MECINYLNALKALGDETRLLIFKSLLKGELCACKLLELVNCNQSTLSHHMKLLVESGLVTARKDWKWTHYSVNLENLNLLLSYLKEN